MSSSEALLVWILQTGEPLHIDSDDPRPMRAMNLSNALALAGHRVVLWSAEFNHLEKRQREQTERRIAVSEQLEIRLIPSRGYRRNIGAERLLDHAQLAANLKGFLRAPDALPDVAFVGYPPIETAAVMTRWLAQRGVPALLDVKDQWPTVFLSALPAAARPMARVALWPYFHLARRAMREATGLCAMADSFLDWALELAGRGRGAQDAVFPLTPPLDRVAAERLGDARRWWDEQGIRDDGTLRIMFAGSHTRAFDFEPVREAARRGLDAGRACEFVLCGHGELSEALGRMMRGLGNVHFPGWVDRPRLVALAERCHAALAPYRDSEDFRMSLPNKVLDALSLGLPIISPLPGEVGRLIADHGVGLSYGEDSGRSLYDCIAALAEESALQAELAASARKTYADRFAFDRVYGGLVAHLEQLARPRPAERKQYA